MCRNPYLKAGHTLDELLSIMQPSDPGSMGGIVGFKRALEPPPTDPFDPTVRILVCLGF
jgi:hypothetical protein